MSARRALGALLSAALLCAGACTDDAPVAAPERSATPESSPSPTPEPLRGGSVRVGMIGSPATLDPYSPVASDLTYALVRPIYPSLFELSPRGEPEPSLAQSIEPTQTGVRVVLRRARWSTGRAITSRDVLASIARASAPSGFARVHTASAESRRVVVLRGKVGDWPRALATVAYVLPGGQMRGRPGRLVGGGPWRTTAYRPGLKVTYARNRHVARLQRPYLDGVTVFFFESVPTLLDWLGEGRLDVAVPPSTLNLGERLEGMRFEHADALGWESVWLDFEQTLTRPERAAVVAAIDRNALQDGLIRGGGRLSGTLHPGPRGARGPWKNEMGRRSKIDEAIRISIPAGDELLFLLERAILIQLARRKIDVDLIIGSAADFYGQWRDSSPADVAVVRSAGGPGLRDPRRAARELTALPLAHVRTYMAWWRGIEGIEVNPTFEGALWNMETWWRSRRG